MKKVKELADALNIVPKLRLGEKLAGGGVKATGPHTVKFIEEPMTVMGKDHAGKPQKELKFIVEENGKKYRWNVAIMNREGGANYLIERLLDIEVGDTKILEMLKTGAKNYIDIRDVGEEARAIDEEEEGHVEGLDEASLFPKK